MKLYTYLPGKQKDHTFMVPYEEYKDKDQKFDHDRSKWVTLIRHPNHDRRFLNTLSDNKNEKDWTEYEIDVNLINNKDKFYFSIVSIESKKLYDEIGDDYLDFKEYEWWADDYTWVEFISEDTLKMCKRLYYLDTLFDYYDKPAGKELFLKAMKEVETRSEYMTVKTESLYPTIWVKTTGVYYPYTNKKVVAGRPALESLPPLITKW